MMRVQYALRQVLSELFCTAVASKALHEVHKELSPPVASTDLAETCRHSIREIQKQHPVQAPADEEDRRLRLTADQLHSRAIMLLTRTRVAVLDWLKQR